MSSRIRAESFLFRSARWAGVSSGAGFLAASCFFSSNVGRGAAAVTGAAFF
eukprot:CAMPEP_0170628798 /NCGR_PEP_ID=MMETSP0224-20130122/32925_1 /TAXON_ID=285029 /ORGANISM="Togula jolla, Strain CCCM 725" /LENGTH=50 /DNA_ID=CAMNT_0010956345 /DNA_START=91 /DNA_END=240 /DNA_ORIENTATION=-